MTDRAKEALMVGIVVASACFLAWVAFFVVSELIHFVETMNDFSSNAYGKGAVALAMSSLGLCVVLSADDACGEMDA